MPIQDRHAYEIPLEDGRVNNIDMQPLGNVGHDVIIFGDEQDSEDGPGVLVTGNEERDEQGEQSDSNDGDEESIDINRNDITDVDKDNINKGVTDVEGELIPDEVGRGDITDENENNIGVPTLEEDVGGESDGIRRSTRNKFTVRDYEPSFGGNTYVQQMFNVRHTKDREQNKTSIQGIAVNALFTHMVDSETDNNFKQMSFNRGQKLFGKRAVAAMVKEYNQMEYMSVLMAINPDALTKEQKHEALRAVNLIKQKRTGSIKGCMCANGAPHMKFVPREEARSPTLSLEALIMSLI